MENQIKEIKEEMKGKVGWVVFTWIITVATGAIGAASMIGVNAQQKADIAIQRISNTEGDIKSIETSLKFIQQSLERIEKQLR